MKRNYGRWAVLAGWSGVIFAFSAQTATDSSALSGRFVDILIRIFAWLNLSEEAALALYEPLSKVLRKGAHFSVFFVLGLLAVWAFWGRRQTGTKQSMAIPRPFGHALAYCFCYAVSDELHQLFVPGRAGRPLDVAIDTAGALLAVGLCWLVWSRKSRKPTAHDGAYNP